MKFNRFVPLAILGLFLGSNSFADDIVLQGYDPSGGTPRVANVMKSVSQQAAKRHDNELFHFAGDPVIGNPNGKVSLVVFFDFQCPHCITFNPTVNALINANPDLRVVMKEYPIRGDISTYAAKAALVANQQGKYLAFHTALLRSAHGLTEGKILELAKNVGLNVDALKNNMNSDTVKNTIKANRELGLTIGVEGTPALFIGKTDGSGNVIFIMGAVDRATVQAAIAKMG